MLQLADVMTNPCNGGVVKALYSRVGLPYTCTEATPIPDGVLLTGGDVSSLLYATPPPVEVGRRPPKGGGGSRNRTEETSPTWSY